VSEYISEGDISRSFESFSAQLSGKPQCFLAIAIANTYQQSRVNQWTTSIVEQCLSQLSKLGKPFKYIGVHRTTYCAVRWENKSMYCIVNVFRLAI
uniref:Dynein light chain Tctex-type 1b n=1 Tax=Mastacembelus armatus TaxID=205130 RepID=A0A3Q3LPX5_9TELE